MATSCHTWTPTSHIRHPWFDNVVMKRKHRETVGSGDEDSEQPEAPPSTPVLQAVPSTSTSTGASAQAPPRKRRRCSILEHGFAHLSLGGEVPPPLTPPIMDTEMLTPPAYPSPPLQPAYIVEEPRIPEIKMKTSSWYEPEPDRIVITDMDSFTQSDDEEEENVTINPVLLDRIRTSKFDSSNGRRRPPSTTSNTSQALVLFRPLPLSDREIERANEIRAKREENMKVETKRERAVEVDDDAMDVEP
ncbi:hypothetical protein BDZ97DRAFT_1912576 [Flammula alnicola]|nr:hypothetical protein BDZ97DRAFT_1912576 [Flammula alnicola]